MDTPQIIENDDGTVKYFSMHHPLDLVNRLDSFRSKRLMTDIGLKVKDKLFPCHKLILIAVSSYFEGTFSGRNFSESTADTVILEDVSPEAVNSLLKFMYTGSLIISEDIIADLLFAANMWEMKDVLEYCHTFLKRLLEQKSEKAVSILHLSTLYNFTDLIIRSRKWICENFDMTSKDPEFVQLSYEEMTIIVVSKHLSAPKELILSALVKWFEYNQTTDQIDMNSLFSLIPLHQVNLDCLREKLSSEFLQKFPLCTQYFKNVIKIIEHSLAVESIVVGQNDEQISGNEIYVLDAFYDSKSLFKFNVESGYCDRLADVPHHHNCYGSAFIKNKIFAIDAWDYCNVSKYDLQLNTWSSCRPLPSKRKWSTVGVLNETIYVCGGRENGNRDLNSVVKYNLETDEWSSVAEMQHHRIGACAVGFNGFLYVIGGDDHDENTLSSCERYSNLTNRWESISSLPSPRSGAAVVGVNNLLYVLGGWDESSEVSSVFKYDLSSGSWSSCAEMPYSASYLSACAVGSRIFVSGGWDGSRLKKSAVFDINLNSWTESPELPHPIDCHSSFPVIE